MLLGDVGLEGVVAGGVGGALGALEPAALQEMVVPRVGLSATGTLILLSAWTACKVLAVLSDDILVHEFLDLPILGERRLSLGRAVAERDQNVPLLRSRRSGIGSLGILVRWYFSLFPDSHSLLSDPLR